MRFSGKSIINQRFTLKSKAYFSVPIKFFISNIKIVMMRIDIFNDDEGYCNYEEC